MKDRTRLEGTEDQPSLGVVLSRATAESSFRDEVLKSEICFARFVADHTVSFATADHFTKLCKCKIAEAFSCARTKTTALVTHALGPATESEVTKLNNHSQFYVMEVMIILTKRILGCL